MGIKISSVIFGALVGAKYLQTRRERDLEAVAAIDEAGVEETPAEGMTGMGLMQGAPASLIARKKWGKLVGIVDAGRVIVRVTLRGGRTEQVVLPFGELLWLASPDAANLNQVTYAAIPRTFWRFVRAAMRGTVEPGVPALGRGGRRKRQRRARRRPARGWTPPKGRR